MRYEDEEPLGAARARYFEANGFGADGGYAKKWVKVELGPVPFWFPNSDARRRAVRYHDLHHVLTDYDTDWTGEAEIGAWEVGSGCADHWAAWYLNLSVMFIGMIVAPRRTFRAFVRGRHTRNLYREPWETIGLQERVGAWRRRLGLGEAAWAPTAGDRLAFAGFVAPALLCWLAGAAPFLALPVLLYAVLAA